MSISYSYGCFDGSDCSTGGYAYVYLVRTPQPVNGTTQHVLKRIAVPNEGMLAEVKKEVDIMVRPSVLLHIFHSKLYDDSEY